MNDDSIVLVGVRTARISSELHYNCRGGKKGLFPTLQLFRVCCFDSAFLSVKESSLHLKKKGGDSNLPRRRQLQNPTRCPIQVSRFGAQSAALVCVIQDLH